MPPQKKTESARHRNGWDALTEILLTSMSKGQAPLFVVGVIVMLIIWRMPPSEVSRLAFDVLKALRTGELAGYALALATILGWFFHSRWQRKSMNAEMKRLSTLRTELQKRLGRTTETSN